MGIILKFISKNKHKKILFLELGVGRMTPMFIQQSFGKMTLKLPHAEYITINPQHAIVPKILENKGFAIKEAIAPIFNDAVNTLQKENK